MSQDRTTVQGVIEQFLRRSDKNVQGLGAETPLFGDGLGLDSLEAAELSAVLEDAFGTDPFSAGDSMPETVGEILAFYEVAQSA